MIKLILCCILCASTLMTSLELYRRKEHISETAEELSDVIGRMISLLRFESADVYTLCRECFGDNYPGFREISGNFHNQWISACQSITADIETVRLFTLVGETLGTSDTQSQTELLQAIRDDMREHAKALKQNAADTKKLYTTLGALSGLAAAIMII